MRPVLVVSPHLDDAVLSCGQFLAGRPDAVVATVFAGIPDGGITTHYDRKCGFVTSTEAMTTRRLEDITALSFLGATAVHMPLLDNQYADWSTPLGQIANAINDLVVAIEPEFIVGPIGLMHPDHVVVSEAMECVVGGPVYLYEELPYRVTYPREVGSAQQRLRTRGYRTTETFIGDGPLHRKLQALWCYRSQMRLPEFDNPGLFTAPERFWHVSAA